MKTMLIVCSVLVLTGTRTSAGAASVVWRMRYAAVVLGLLLLPGVAHAGEMTIAVWSAPPSARKIGSIPLEEIRHGVRSTTSLHVENLGGDFLEPDQIVVPMPFVLLAIRYPLGNGALVRVEAPSMRGFTRRELVRAVSAAYHEIYRLEHAVSNPLPPGERGKLINRNQTEGPFQIWGHDLSDLYLEGLEIRALPSGMAFIAVQIGS